MGDVAADGSEQEPLGRTVPTGAEDEKLRVGSLVDEDGRRVAFDRERLDLDVMDGEPLERSAEDVLGVVLGRDERIGRGRECLADVRRGWRLPGTDNAERQASELRLGDGESQRCVCVGRAIDTDDDLGWDGAHSTETRGSARSTRRSRWGLPLGTAMDATTPVASATAMIANATV